jgi:hypothetical protein
MMADLLLLPERPALACLCDARLVACVATALPLVTTATGGTFVQTETNIRGAEKLLHNGVIIRAPKIWTRARKEQAKFFFNSP